PVGFEGQAVGDGGQLESLAYRGSNDLVPAPHPPLGLVEHRGHVGIDAEVGEVDRRDAALGQTPELVHDQVGVDVRWRHGGADQVRSRQRDAHGVAHEDTTGGRVDQAHEVLGVSGRVQDLEEPPPSEVDAVALV